MVELLLNAFSIINGIFLSINMLSHFWENMVLPSLIYQELVRLFLRQRSYTCTKIFLSALFLLHLHSGWITMSVCHNPMLENGHWLMNIGQFEATTLKTVRHLHIPCNHHPNEICFMQLLSTWNFSSRSAWNFLH